MAAQPRLAVAAAAAFACVGAAPDPSVHLDGPWRMTAVTHRLVRIEYDVGRVFVDDPTDAFVRGPSLGAWRGSQAALPGGWASVQTDSVTVSYLRSAPPARGTVKVESIHALPWMSGARQKATWSWGDPADGNLGGTARTLDLSAETLNLNCSEKVSPTMDNSQMHCAWGLVSAAGSAVVSQTGAPVWRDGLYAPSRNSVDVFVFLHGLDFAGALKDFVHAAGPPAVPPRYALGTIFTRWFDFDSDSALALVDDFEARSFPLDAWIFDMNWHQFGPAHDLWGSFTWNEDSFPNLQGMLDAFMAKGLRIGANTHDHDGIRTTEETFQQVCAFLGHQPCNSSIPFDLYNKTFALAQEDIAWMALQTKGEKQGIDFAWIDYQQGETDKLERTRIPGINPTMVLNRLRSTDHARHGEDTRSLIFSRWGGVGSHKYPVGFSGDQKHSWKGLAFLPYFTSTAANVAFGYWSHDTVGGDHGDTKDYELSVRWFQTSAWSPVLRMHDKGQGTGKCATTEVCARVVPWDVPAAFYAAIRSASWQRDEMMPYIYTAAFSASSTGLTLARPMYYEDPTDPALYDLGQQYLFGPDMIVSPITSPSGDATASDQALGAVRWSIYAPSKSAWVDVLNGEFASGTRTLGVYGIMDVPRLARQGAVIAMRPRLAGEGSLARAGAPLRAVEFRVAPAAVFYGSVDRQWSGSGEAVDDDGVTTAYLRGSYSTISCNYTFQNGTFQVHVARSGSFPGQPSLTTVRLSFPQMPPMLVLKPAGASVEYSREIAGPLVTVPDVAFGPMPPGSELFLELRVDAAYSKALPLFVGLLGRVRRARYVKDALDAANVPYGAGRANLTACVLAAASMSAPFAARLEDLWRGALAEGHALLKSDATLRGDARRSRFIADMLSTPETRETQQKARRLLRNLGRPGPSRFPPGSPPITT
ncbi:unnamed protein product [Prorocentrum cordatum]|uniref:Alpha-glucosidase n=1 Tax=Prorocentrum cordatum TaxID=2364126 RepID=A0ABN9PUN1_9DINO|nr:unnamed protein product [Polarella glacialis]